MKWVPKGTWVKLSEYDEVLAEQDEDDSPGAIEAFKVVEEAADGPGNRFTLEQQICFASDGAMTSSDDPAHSGSRASYAWEESRCTRPDKREPRSPRLSMTSGEPGQLQPVVPQSRHV